MILWRKSGRMEATIQTSQVTWLFNLSFLISYLYFIFDLIGFRFICKNVRGWNETETEMSRREKVDRKDCDIHSFVSSYALEELENTNIFCFIKFPWPT